MAAIGQQDTIGQYAKFFVNLRNTGANVNDGTDENVKYDTHRGTMEQIGQRGGESLFDLKRAHLEPN